MSKTAQGGRGISGRMTHGAPLAVLLAAGLFVVYRLFPILLPVLELIALAMLLSLILRTVVNGLENLGAPPWLAVVLMLTGLGAFLALLWLVVIPNVVREVQILISQLPQIVGSLERFARDLPVLPDPSQLAQRAQDLFSKYANPIPSVLMSAATFIASVVVTIFLAVYLATNPGAYVSGLLRLVPRGRREGVREFIGHLGERLRGWIVGLILVATFVGTAGGVGLWLLGVPLALTFGIIAGFLNIIPYLGSILGGLLPALVALTVSPTKALLVVVLFVVINQVEGNFLQPVVMGRQIGVPEAMILISILILGVLLGPIIGALLAAPVAVLVAVLVDELTEREPSPDDHEDENAGEKK